MHISSIFQLVPKVAADLNIFCTHLEIKLCFFFKITAFGSVELMIENVWVGDVILKIGININC